MKRRLPAIILNIFLIALGAVTVLPFLWMIFSSFKPNSEISALNQTILPKAFTIDNYISMQESFNFIKLFANSLFIAILVTVIVVYTSTIGGFVLSKYRFRGRNLLFAFIMSTMMIPWAVTIIPKYTMIETFGWIDSYLAIIVPGIFSGFGIFMMRQQMESIPDEIIEAARIDGANEFFIFHRIVFPMCKNGISSIAIFQFLWSWEDFLWPYLVITDRDKQLLSVGLRMFSGQYTTDHGSLFAATAVSILPIIIVYIIFQKQFIAGIASSAVKG